MRRTRVGRLLWFCLSVSLMTVGLGRLAARMIVSNTDIGPGSRRDGIGNVEASNAQS